MVKMENSCSLPGQETASPQKSLQVSSDNNKSLDD